MPVPVPQISKPSAHPVFKKNNSGNLKANPFQNLTRTLPVSPTGPPPSYGTREEWIESLPSWRRQKPRRIWEEDITSRSEQPAVQDFTQGLIAAGNATVIKGERAQACIPPLYTSLEPSAFSEVQDSAVMPAFSSEADDEVHFNFPQLKWEQCTNRGYVAEEQPQDFAAPNPSPASIDTDVSIIDAHAYERSAFSPVLEEESPDLAGGHGSASSPLGPLTPFCDFVDRMAPGPQSSVKPSGPGMNDSGNPMLCRVDKSDNLRSLQHNLAIPAIGPPAPAQAPEASPNSASGYKKLAEHLSEWMAIYVWKVCTKGYNLPSAYVNSASTPIALIPDSPPRNLAPSIRSVLLSTLLQPSAVFLALWYITQLPVYCGTIVLGADRVKESRFRTALFGEPRTSTSSNDSIVNLPPMDESMPFRLTLLGCMLANKWLDDHTFSNKTWHSISNVPIQMLNELEILALDLFSYNLSVPSEKWSKWMEHIRSYHLSSIPPSYAQPISRPSSNPNLIIRNMIEDIIRTRAIIRTSLVPQAVFLGLEERKKERLEKERAVDDIDLDEDGPLREEYLPRRRSNSSKLYQGKAKLLAPRKSMAQMPENVLPPPAKWSPAGDEPILRDRHRASGNYVAVQPSGMPVFPSWAPSYPQLGHETVHDPTWVPYHNFASASYEVFNHPLAFYNSYSYGLPVPGTHLRAHSLSHDGNNSQIHGHVRSYSQTCFDYRGSDIHLGVPEAFPAKELSHNWYTTSHYPYAPPAYAYHPGSVHQPAWVRT